MVDSLRNDSYPSEVIFNEDGTVKNGFGCLMATINRCRLGEHVDYDIQLKHPSGSAWYVTRRYREFRALRDSLQERYNLPTNELAPFPPKKFFYNLSPDFVQQRSLEIETYLNSLLLHYTLPPPPLAKFIDWEKYDIHGITNRLARQLAKDGERIPRREPFVLCVHQLHSINVRMQSPVSRNIYNHSDEDFSSVTDFISQVKQLKLYVSMEKLHNSNIAINSLTFDLSPFKSLDYLELCNVEMGRMRGFEVIKSSVTQLVVSRSLKNLNNFILGDLFAAGNGDWVYGENPVSTIPWDRIKTANFSNNFINKIDQTIALLPNVEILHLSNNLLTELPDFTSLTRLRVLFLSDNQLYLKEEPNSPALEPNDEECVIPEAIVISSASAGTVESGGNRSTFQNKPITPLRERLGEVQILILANNGLRSASIVEGIRSLQHLDLSGNKIASFDELICLGDLPHLNSLELLGNPICEDPYYRRNVLNILGPRFPLIVLDGHRVTAKEYENVRLFQALMKGGVFTQLSPNTPISATKSCTRSTENSINRPESRNVELVSSSPLPNAPVKEVQHFDEVSKLHPERVSNTAVLDQQNENVEVSMNTSRQSNSYTDTIPQEVTESVSNQVATKSPVVSAALTSSTRIQVPNARPEDFACDFSISEVVSNGQPAGSNFYESSVMNTGEFTYNCSNSRTSDIAAEQVDLSKVSDCDATQSPIDKDIDNPLEITDKMETANISEVASAFPRAQLSTNTSKQIVASGLKDATNHSFDISSQMTTKNAFGSESLGSYKGLDNDNNSRDQSALSSKCDDLVHERSSVPEQKCSSGVASSHESSNCEDRNSESVLSTAAHSKSEESNGENDQN
nr:nischarin [Hymenolepis microstoma]